METRRFDQLTLALLPGQGPQALCDAVRLPDLHVALQHPREHPALFSAAAVEALESGEARSQAEAQLHLARRQGVRIVGWGEADYPQLLGRIFDPPPVLWVKGTLLADQGQRSLAVVGSRRPTPAGAVLARSLAAELARSGLTIVSGLALGIDGEAHRGALAAGGRTVAVLGSGLDLVHPRSHLSLSEQIVERGAVVSEFPLGTPPFPAHFPRRNRVIAGWAEATVVVEAASRSGALVTARLALDEGREVMAVPGHPSSPTAGGTNALIRDGAVLVRDAADVAEQMGWPLAPAPPLGGEAVLSVLRRDAPSTLEELSARSGLSGSELLARLTVLELERKVHRLPGALFVRSL